MPSQFSISLVKEDVIPVFLLDDIYRLFMVIKPQHVITKFSSIKL